MILRNQRVYVADRELTLEVGALALELGVEPQDDTRLQATTRVYAPGLLTAGWSLEGFWESESATDSLDEDLFGDLGGVVPVSILAAAGALGDEAYFLEGLETEYVPLGGEVGMPHRFSLGGVAAGRPVRGVVLHRGQITATGSGAGVNLGASNGKVVFAALHVTSVTGTSPSMTMRVQRDTDNTFPSPATQDTFAARTAKGSQVISAAGSGASDVWWRADWTVSGTNPVFNALVVLGIADGG